MGEIGSAEAVTERAVGKIGGHDALFRLGSSLLMAGASLLALPSLLWPAIWFAATALVQVVAFVLSTPMRRDPAKPVSPRRQAAYSGALIASAVVFAAAGPMFWYLGSWGARLFALFMMVGAAVHVVVRSSGSPRQLWICITPFLAQVQLLPLLSFVTAPPDKRGMLGVIVLSATLLVARIVAAACVSLTNTRRTQAALDEARRDRERAEAASAAKSEFLDLMGHELRTPLNGVLGMAQAMSAADLAPEQRKQLEVIRASAETLLQLVNDVMLFSGSEPVGTTPGGAAEPRDAAPFGEDPQLRVLAAEDNPTNQLVLRTLLEHAGVAVHIVSDGEEAVEAWRSAPWDVVLMDIRMPRMDGITATRAIRSLEAAAGRAHTPILAVTADATAHQARAYVEAGMDGLVSKPIQLAELAAVVSAVAQPTLRALAKPAA
jgi:CheY-like chemotaxis protein